jgi:hypothetical protein
MMINKKIRKNYLIFFIIIIIPILSILPLAILPILFFCSWKCECGPSYPVFVLESAILPILLGLRIVPQDSQPVPFPV